MDGGNERSRALEGAARFDSRDTTVSVVGAPTHVAVSHQYPSMLGGVELASIDERVELRGHVRMPPLVAATGWASAGAHQGRNRSLETRVVA